MTDTVLIPQTETVVIAGEPAQVVQVGYAQPAGSQVQISGDLGGSSSGVQVTGTHLASPLPVPQGGTGAGSAGAALTALGAASAAALTAETARALAAEAVLTAAVAGFTQGFTSQQVVTVTHNLGRKPAVTVVDTANDVCVGDVVYLSANAVRLTFSAPFSGTAICS